MKKKNQYKNRYKLRFFIILLLIIAVLSGYTYYLFENDNYVNEKTPFNAEKYETGMKIMMAARAYINTDLKYDSGYFSGGYPPDNLGVCTDVVWKAFQGIDVNLKKLVDKDIANNFGAYSQVISTADPNIDFRYVPVLEIYFSRNAEVLTNDLRNLLAWAPGDIVIFESSHVAIISDLRNIFGYPYLIQHGRDPAAEEDRILASDGMKISGHYRIIK